MLLRRRISDAVYNATVACVGHSHANLDAIATGHPKDRFNELPP